MFCSMHVCVRTMTQRLSEPQNVTQLTNDHHSRLKMMLHKNSRHLFYFIGKNKKFLWNAIPLFIQLNLWDYKKKNIQNRKLLGNCFLDII